MIRRGINGDPYKHDFTEADRVVAIDGSMRLPDGLSLVVGRTYTVSSHGHDWVELTQLPGCWDSSRFRAAADEEA